MNIYMIRDNLKNTIFGKEKMLAEQRSALALSHFGPTPAVGAEMACIATINFLEINIGELKRILADVESCCTTTANDSWAGSVDRQGGSFTPEELEDNGWH